MEIIKAKINDEDVLWLCQIILDNANSQFTVHPSPLTKVGIPIGNLTSQFFANVYPKFRYTKLH